jgi:peptidoglycan hydrolase CwlO-like protein
VDLRNAQNQLLALQKDLGDANDQIGNINANISAVKAQLTDLLTQSSQLNQQIVKVQGDLGTLRQRLPQEQNFLS